jgi:hypothetical protein
LSGIPVKSEVTAQIEQSFADIFPSLQIEEAVLRAPLPEDNQFNLWLPSQS